MVRHQFTKLTRESACGFDSRLLRRENMNNNIDDIVENLKPERIRYLARQVIELRNNDFKEASLAMRRNLLEEIMRYSILLKTGCFVTKIGKQLLENYEKEIDPDKTIVNEICNQMDKSTDSLHKYSHGITFERINTIKRIGKCQIESYKNRDGAGSLVFFASNGDNKPEWYVKCRALNTEYIIHVGEYADKTEKNYFELIKRMYGKGLSNFPVSPFYN